MQVHRSVVPIYTPGWCLAQEHNTMPPTRARTRTARSSRVERTTGGGNRASHKKNIVDKNYKGKNLKRVFHGLAHAQSLA